MLGVSLFCGLGCLFGLEISRFQVRGVWTRVCYGVKVCEGGFLLFSGYGLRLHLISLLQEGWTFQVLNGEVELRDVFGILRGVKVRGRFARRLELVWCDPTEFGVSGRAG